MKTILLVEDVQLNRDLMVQLLEDRYKILQAADGNLGIAMAVQNQPDLIFMDLSLPGLDGWKAIKILKTNPRTKQIPIVAITAHAMIGDKEKVTALGCNEYLTKPIDENLLFKTVRQFLSPKKS